MGHRKDFEWLVLQRFGMEEAQKVDWSGPRLICIAATSPNMTSMPSARWTAISTSSATASLRATCFCWSS